MKFVLFFVKIETNHHSINMKFAVVLLCVSAVVAGTQVSLPKGYEKYVIISKTFLVNNNQAQFNAPGMGSGMGMAMPFGGLSPAYFFQVVVLQAEAEKLLSKPDLPEDLRQRAMDVMSNAGEAFETCNTLTVLPWMQIRCASTQMKLVKNQLKAIENEATARATAEAVTSGMMTTK